MNPFNLYIPRIRGELPIGGVIPANRLDDYVGTAAVLARARGRAAILLRQARHRRVQARREADALLAQAREQARIRADAEAHAASASAVAETVSWLIDARELESRVAASLALRCRDWVADTVNQFAGEADRSALIAHRIQSHIRELSSHGRFSIHLALADFDAVLARLPEERPFEAVADPAMRPGEAYLDSPFVRLHLDLDRHLAALLAPIGGRVDKVDAQARASVVPVTASAAVAKSDPVDHAGIEVDAVADLLSLDALAGPIEARELAIAFDPEPLGRLLTTSAPLFEAMSESSADERRDALISRARVAVRFDACAALDDRAGGRPDDLPDPWADGALFDGGPPSLVAPEIRQ